MTPGPDDSESLDTGDAIAAEILAQLEPLRFREAEDAAERDACLRLRYRAVLEMGMAAAGSLPDAIETDEFDAGAVHILGLDAGRPIATSRIVLPVRGRPLPLETAFDLRIPDSEGVVEMGRVVVDPEYRGDGHSMFMGLAAQAWRSMRARGYVSAVGATPKRLIALFEALGFTVTLLGEPRIHWGEERWPFLCVGRPAIRRLAREWLAGEAGAPPARPPEEKRTSGDQ